MFGQNKNNPPPKTNSRTSTIIAEDVTIKDGNLSGDGGRGGVTVSGVFFSNIDIEGDLVISANGVLNGNVKAENTYVYGTIEGNLAVKGKVYIYSKGKVAGDVLCASFMVEEGADFKGHCSNTVAQSVKLLSVKGAVAEGAAPVSAPDADKNT